MKQKQQTRQLESHRVESELSNLIMTLELTPGSVVTQDELASRLGCGRTPLREAIHRLENEGIVRYLPKRGILISGLAPHEIREFIRALVELDRVCVRLAKERLDDQKIKRMKAIITAHERASAKGDFGSAAMHDYEFHMSLAYAAGNRFVSRAMVPLHREGARLGCLLWHHLGSAQCSCDEHSEIVEALSQKDFELAERLIVQHSLNTVDRLMRFIADESMAV